MNAANASSMSTPCAMRAAALDSPPLVRAPLLLPSAAFSSRLPVKE
jgi:hypothetical protein